jgi:hypothetical protein
MNNYRIKNVRTLSEQSDAVNKNYSDNSLNTIKNNFLSINSQYKFINARGNRIKMLVILLKMEMLSIKNISIR